MAYLDDIIIFSKNEVKYLKHIKVIFKKLKEAGLKLKDSKCDFFKREIHYLGHLISVNGVQPLPKKLDSIHDMPKTKVAQRNQTIPWIDPVITENSYHNFLTSQGPSSKLLAHDCEFVWTEQCDHSFQMLKETLCSAPVLKYPDTRKPYTLYTRC